MSFAFNPLTGNFDLKGSGGGGASYIDGEVATYTDLPLDGSAALNTAWLVRQASGTWLIARKPAGIYIRTATAGVSRDADWTYAGILPDVFNDANFLLYDNADSSKNLAFQLSGISASTTRTLTVPDSSGTIALSNQVFDFYYATAPAGATGGSGSVWTFTIPSWSNHQLITMIGAGGGGGSGRVGASGTVNAGGGGGGSGAFGFFATRITGGSVIEVLVGAGGAGGAAVTASNQNGNAGTTGGDVRVRWVTPNITLRHGSTFGAGGGGGGGGNNTLGTNGTAGASTGATILGTGGNGAGGTAGSLTGTPGGGANNNSTQGGRAGGSIDATPTAYNGGSIGGSPFTDVRAALYLPDLSPAIGTGARGGNASTTANAQNGDNAGGLGGGGGGGGAALNGFNSGAGGNGGDGFVRIVCF
jgi:hypothetical protein